MNEKEITVTEASRNFADCVNRAHYQGTTFVLFKNGAPVARIVPNAEKTCTGPELAVAMASVRLSDEELRCWRNDLKKARKSLAPPLDKWKS